MNSKTIPTRTEKNIDNTKSPCCQLMKQRPRAPLRFMIFAARKKRLQPPSVSGAGRFACRGYQRGTRELPIFSFGILFLAFLFYKIELSKKRTCMRCRPRIVVDGDVWGRSVTSNLASNYYRTVIFKAVSTTGFAHSGVAASSHTLASRPRSRCTSNRSDRLAVLRRSASSLLS